MKYPTLSIVIPCYNEEKLIAKNFECIFNQSILPEEVIFVDNNSTDNSLGTAKSFRDKFKEKGIDFRVLEEKQQGQIFARSLGFGLAQSDLIGTLDTDYLISEKWVEIAKKFFNKNKKINVISGSFYFYNLSFIFRIQFFFVFLWSNIEPFYGMWGGNAVFRKTAYKQIGGLSGCSQMVKDLGLKFQSDDVYLSERFRLIGKRKFVWKLKASGVARGESDNGIRQMIDFFRIRKYINKKYKK